MPPLPLVGQTYPGRSKALSAQRTINLYPEILEIEEDKQNVLQAVPGRRVFATLPDAPHRGAIEINNRVLVVAGGTLAEIFSDGSFVVRGNVTIDDWPATLSASGTASFQVFITSGGHGYVFNLQTNTLVQVPDPDLPAPITMGDFADGFFFALKRASRQFNTSTLEDAMDWDGLDVYERSQRGDDLVSLKVNHRELWLLGNKTGEVWFNSGAATNPWTPIPGGLLEFGTGAAFSIAKVDNTVMWLVQNEHGARFVAMAGGNFAPVRVSTNGLDAHWQKYSRVDDAESISYQEDGHTFYVLTFPTPGESFAYDAATKMWHERMSWNTTTGMFQADKARTHVYAFGKHLVGDRFSGKLFEQSLDFHDDAGDPRRWLRVTQHVASQFDEWVYPSEVQLFAQMGVGLSAGQGSDPKVMLRVSSDGGDTWSSERTASLGKQGVSLPRAARWRRLPRTRDPLFEFSGSDAVQTVLTGANLELV